MPYKLSELADLLKATWSGQDVEINGVNALAYAQKGEISFVESPRFLEEAKASKASALIVSPALKEKLVNRNLLVVPNPRVALAKIAWLFYREPRPEPGISPLAFVAEGAEIHESASVLPFVYVGKGARIEAGVILYPGVFVGEEVFIGRESIIYPNAVLYPRTRIGQRVIIHAGAVIGADGFGFAFDGEKHLKIPHFGHVEIEDEVEIGANTAVDRATFGVTLIKKGAKLDNLIQVAHNVEIGQASVLAAQVGLTGSVKIGNYVMIGGQAGINNQVGDQALIAAKAGVAKAVPPKTAVAGIPAIEIGKWRRCVAAYERLPEILKEIRELSRRLAVLEEALNGRKDPQS